MNKSQNTQRNFESKQVTSESDNLSRQSSTQSFGSKTKMIKKELNIKKMKEMRSLSTFHKQIDKLRSPQSARGVINKLRSMEETDTDTPTQNSHDSNDFCNEGALESPLRGHSLRYALTPTTHLQNNELKIQSVKSEKQIHFPNQIALDSPPVQVQQIAYLPDLPSSEIIQKGVPYPLKQHIYDIMEHYDIIQMPSSFLEGVKLPQQGLFFMVTPEDPNHFWESKVKEHKQLEPLFKPQ